MQKTAGKYGVHGKPRNVRLYEISTPSLFRTHIFHENFARVPYSTKHWWEKTLADLAVDSQSAKVLSPNVFFHHDFVQSGH